MERPSTPPIVTTHSRAHTVTRSLPCNAGAPELAWALASVGHLVAPLSPTHLARLTRLDYATGWPDTPPASSHTYQVEVCDPRGTVESCTADARPWAGVAGAYDCALDAVWHAIHGGADPATFGFAPEQRELAVTMDLVARYNRELSFVACETPAFAACETPAYVAALARSAGLSRGDLARRDLQARRAGLADVLDSMMAMMDGAAWGEGEEE